MKKVLVFVVCFCALHSLYAATYKGQREFSRKCVECHQNRQVFVSAKDSFEWEMLMENKGKELIKLHLENEEAKESWEYFESSRFKKNMKHLKDFFLEYAKDSGNVPACN